MLSQRELYQQALDRQMYDDVKKMNEGEILYTLLYDVFSKKIELEDENLWSLYLEVIRRNDWDLDRAVWGVLGEQRYPQSQLDEAKRILEFFDQYIDRVDINLEWAIDSIGNRFAEFTKNLIIIKLYSLAIRRYPGLIDDEKFKSIGMESHWIRRAAKILVYINGGCEYGNFSYHQWKFEEISDYCSQDVNIFFLASVNSRAFWVPLTALMFDGLAKKNALDPRIIEFVNDYGSQIMDVFHPAVRVGVW